MDAALQPSVRDLSEPTHRVWPTVRRLSRSSCVGETDSTPPTSSFRRNAGKGLRGAHDDTAQRILSECADPHSPSQECLERAVGLMPSALTQSTCWQGEESLHRERCYLGDVAQQPP